MEFKQHVKGVLIAIASATILLFSISFFVGDQITVDHDVVVNASKEKVFEYLKDPQNFKDWMFGAEGVDPKPLVRGEGVQYVGFDKQMHTFKYLISESAGGLEIHYDKEEEPQAIFQLQVKAKEAGCVVYYVKMWNIGSNPLSKVFSLSMDEDILEGMKKDMKAVKAKLEE